MFNPKSFSLRLVRGIDTGIDPKDCVDEFEIVADGQPAFRITLDYGMDGVEQTMTVTALIPECPAWELPFIGNGFYLGAKVMNFLDDLLYAKDVEFYADCFVDEEGNPITYPLSEVLGVR